MPACIVQWYVNVPAVLNVLENVAPPLLSPEEAPSANVTLCDDDPDAQVQVTVVPTDTCALAGVNELSLTLMAFVTTGFEDPPVCVPPVVPPLVVPVTEL